MQAHESKRSSVMERTRHPGIFKRGTRYGDLVVVLARYTGRGKGSGVEVDTEGAHVWTLRDGKAVRLEIFADRIRALEAVGLAA
jgi:ketosteroid isomerase-like protein